jgi:ectoine hydroxylase-related dioxygenase (phytanoyl-CoA dioxygenase family)
MDRTGYEIIEGVLSPRDCDALGDGFSPDLDDSTADNGPLRIVAESHSHGVLSDEEVLRRARDASPMECLVSRGGVLAMRPLLIHASLKAREPRPRRILHLEYASSLDLTPGLRLAVA